MPETSSVTSSTLAPGDSVSSSGKKGKPGKRERQEARANRSSGVPASASKAEMFSAGGSSEPKPQPGKFPVVFQTGAGEPTRDKYFALSSDVVAPLISKIWENFKYHDKFTEFKANSDLTTSAFGQMVGLSMTLGLAQQLVHAHVNMGLPMGDFAPVNSSNVSTFNSLRAIITQFGEFSVPALGTRFLLKDYPSELKKLMRMAGQVLGGKKDLMSKYWLPVGPTDGSFKLEIASRLNSFLSGSNISVSSTVLEDAVLSGEVPEVWENLKKYLGSPPSPGKTDQRDRFDFLFKSRADEGQFTVAYSTNAAEAALGELGLVWTAPSAGDLCWEYNVKERFGAYAQKWAQMSATFEKFFSMSVGLANRAAASGSSSQLSMTYAVEGITVVRSAVAHSAPEFSLAACFSPGAVFSGPIDRLVVVTTSLSVPQRATEFCQLDWK